MNFLSQRSNITRTQMQSRLWNSYYVVTIILLTFNGMVMALFNNTITLHTESLGLGTTVSGMLVSLGTAVTLFYRFFSAMLTDRIGRQKITCIGLIVMLAGNALCAFSAGFAVLVIGRILQMLGFAVISTSTAIIVVDVIPRQRMGEGIGYSSLGSSLAQAVTPSIAVAIYAVSAFRGTMLFAAAIAAVGFVLCACFLNYEKKDFFAGKEQQPIDRGAAAKCGFRFSDLVERTALHSTFVGMTSTMATTLFSMYLTHYAISNGIDGIGMFFICSSAAMVLARLTTSKLSDRFSTLTSVIPGYVILATAFLLVPLMEHSSALIYLCGILNGLGQGIAVPAINAHAVRSAPEERRGVASSTYLIGHDVGFILGPTLWGVVIEYTGYKLSFRFGSVFVLIGLVYAMCFMRNRDAQTR